MEDPLLFPSHQFYVQVVLKKLVRKNERNYKGMKEKKKERKKQTLYFFLL